MYSPQITEVPVTLFLGAGATKPLGKMLMEEFVTHLHGDQRFASNPLFKTIVYQKADLEYLFEQLEDWKGKEYIKRELGGQTPYYSLTAIPKEAADLESALREKVFAAYREIEDREKLLPLFNELFDGIFIQLDPQKHPLVVFTTNYDPAVEAYCEECSTSYELEDGFSDDRAAGAFIWRRERFDSFTVRGEKKTVVLFKLHGSARWVKREGQIVKLPFAIYADAAQKYENVIIYPATRKVALDDPFFTAYDYFQRTMDTCGCCIVIGYSFRDYDALTKLASASIFNRRLRLLIIDPNSKTLCRELSEKGIRCSGAPQRFGEGITFMHDVSKHIIEALKNQQPATTA